MEQPFLTLYRFFKNHRSVFWIVFSVVLVILAWGASRVELEEDITKFFPQDERVEKLNYVFRNARFAERVVMMVSMKDSTDHPQPDSLVALADTLVTRIKADLDPYIRDIAARVDNERLMEVFNTVPRALPIFLEESDYKVLDSITQPDVARKVLQNHYRQLISPSGIVTKKIIVQDPLGFSFLVLKKLQRLQFDENFELYDDYILTKDHRHLIFFIQLVYPPADTKHNSVLVEKLQALTGEASEQHPQLSASYFGAAVVAAGNARQLRRDTILTVSIMLVLLLIVMLGFFRKKRAPLLLLVPVVFGSLFSLACISVIQGSLSVLALAVGAVVLGVAVNYSLHYLVLLKYTGHGEGVIKELARPLTIGSATTVFAFLSLQFTNAAMLQDIGLFAGLSLIGAALCSLIFLPHLVREDLFPRQSKENWLEKIAAYPVGSNKYVVYGIFLLTPVFFYLAGRVQFNSDMGKLNFMEPPTAEAQRRLETLNKASLNSLYIVSDGPSLQKALEVNERSMPALEALQSSGRVNKISSVSLLMISDSLQRVRMKRWTEFWNAQRQEALTRVVHDEGTKLRFSPRVLMNFDSLITRTHQPLSQEVMNTLRSSFFDNYIIEKDGKATVITLASVKPEDKETVYNSLKTIPSHVVDRQMLTNLFVEYVHADFNFIVTFTAVLVFIALLIAYGRIELTIITFIPMLLTWIWILGIMALLGIEFNIVNVMVSTFIFGLGDDYSIFIMDGLQQEYRAGRKTMPAINASIFLSAVTTVCGLGVLIFAKHPALQSIAAISIIGIVCVFIMAQTVEPFLFRIIISHRAKRGLTPMTLVGICRTFYTYAFFVSGSFLLTIVGLILKLIPFGRSRIRMVYHALIRSFTGLLIFVAYRLKWKTIGRTSATFSRASVIVSNHSSFLDILLTTMLHPKLVLLTNKWVWNSPVFGGVVRLADYYPVMEGAEDSVGRLKDRISEGYSVVVFPEGTRSASGAIGRFHKGAFYMAEAMQLPVQPLLIHGASEGIRKGDMYLNDCSVTLKFLPPIETGDVRFGTGYTERTKKISRYFKEEFGKLANEQETPAYFGYKLINNYKYKGPVLEWYLRIKLRLEKYYAPFHALIPHEASILDLGCGYGFLCYMLQFLSDKRTITGVDFDEEKIETAQHGYRRSERLRFYCANVSTFPLESYDVIIISDVLHYLEPRAQEELLIRCFDALRAGGKIIVRDGNADLRQRHQGTKLTEFFSVNLLKFNKASNALNFISGEALARLATKHGRNVRIQDDTKLTSNVIFVIE